MRDWRGFQHGDTVRLVFDGVCHPFPSGSAYVDGAVIRHYPCDVGDCWIFEYEGETYTVNPAASAFIGMQITARANADKPF